MVRGSSISRLRSRWGRRIRLSDNIDSSSISSRYICRSIGSSILNIPNDIKKKLLDGLLNENILDELLDNDIHGELLDDKLIDGLIDNDSRLLDNSIDDKLDNLRWSIIDRHQRRRFRHQNERTDRLSWSIKSSNWDTTIVISDGI